jgi:oligosaccharide repeat unit polymerase
MLAGWLAAFCVVFVSIQTVLQAASGIKAEGGEVVEAYYGGPMLAYDSIIDGSFPRETGYYSADMFYYILQKVKLINSDSYPPLIRPYVYNTNIYTFLDAFTLDGGIFGAILGSVLVGVAGGWIFKKASRRPSPMMLTVSSMMACSMVDAVANNDFIRINFLMTCVLSGAVSWFVVRRRIDRAAVFTSSAHA